MEEIYGSNESIGGGRSVVVADGTVINDVASVEIREYSEFELFSQQVELVAKRHTVHWSRRWFWKLGYFLEFSLRCWAHNPLPFKEVQWGEGMPIGELIIVEYPPVHDMMPHMALGRMTAAVLLEGVSANAFFVEEEIHVPGRWTTAIIQPYWIEPSSVDD